MRFYRPIYLFVFTGLFVLLLAFAHGTLFPKSDYISDFSSINIKGEFDIWMPRQHNPVFVEPGGAFQVEVRDAINLDLSEDGWRVNLRNDLTSWTVMVENAVRDRVHLGREDGWILTVRVGPEISPELMQLEVSHNAGWKGSSPRSVHVVSDFEEDFYLLHQSDQHISGDSAVLPGGRASKEGGIGSKEALEWMTDIVNVINPRFVVYTGDNNQIFFNDRNWAGLEEAKLRVGRLFDGISGYTVPTVLITGNHDIGWSNYDNFDLWRDQYTSQVGQRSFSFRMGSFYVLGHEWTTTDYLDWARQDFASAGWDPSVDYRLIVSHYYDGLDGWTTVATEADPCDLMLVGHNHRTMTLQTDPYPVFSVGTAQDYQRTGIWKFKRTETGWSTSQLEQYGNETSVHRLVGDWGEPRVAVTYAYPNNGTVTQNTVSITNTLPHQFHNGRVRFLMTSKPGQYQVDGGEVLAQYDADDGSATVVVVRVNIVENGTMEVSIASR